MLIDILPTLSIFIAAGIKIIPSGNKILNQYQIARLCKLSIEVLNSELKKQILSENKSFKSKIEIENLNLETLKN